jgi:hypothetical protein
VHPVLVHGAKFEKKCLIEALDDLRITFHDTNSLSDLLLESNKIRNGAACRAASLESFQNFEQAKEKGP